MIIEAGQALGSFDSRRWIGDVDVPTSVVITDRDRTVPTRRQNDLADAIPGARRFHVDGGHDVCATSPERFVPTLVQATASVVGDLRADAA